MKAVRNNRPGIYDAGHRIRLLPGLNLLDTKEKIKAWKEAKDNSGVLARLEHSERFPGGELQEVTVGSSTPVVSPVKREVIEESDLSTDDGIKGLNRKAAIVKVGECQDIPTLLQWASNETKDNMVKKAIREKIEKLEEPDTNSEDAD